ncbi:hypothetical protein C922_03822 [Plasmodium inui San Antonio 1]|uniref:Uncharacterized protein n=1 Tax=Plasmodium inui San Antonio 1 TaxID=1237626 RepID=W7A9L8_9APIC|nr:hypothetical protein C922_03822 [Plasmodium inui San Antonio 1]EUD65839.1 hypothetical protein C922_03822 [Plasmodium inui San Antonio 1]
MKPPLLVCFLFLLVSVKTAGGLRTRNVVDRIDGGGGIIGTEGASTDRSAGTRSGDQARSDSTGRNARDASSGDQGKNDGTGGDARNGNSDDGKGVHDRANADGGDPRDGANQTNRANLSSCDFTERLNFIPQEKTKVVCNLNPHHGEEVKIWVNKEYEVKCFQNSRVYCPLKDYIMNNTDITTFSPKLKYEIKDVVHRDREVKEYYLQIDEDASDILFFCSIKPKQVSELLEGEVKIHLKREISEEYSVATEDEIHVCDFSKGNLNISPSVGFNHKNDRSVSCIYLVIPNQLFLIKLPKLEIVTNQLLPSLVNCLSQYTFINFNLKHVEETDDSIYFHLTFGDFKKSFNLSCAFDLSEYAVEPCALGKKGSVTFYFSV